MKKIFLLGLISFWFLGNGISQTKDTTQKKDSIKKDKLPRFTIVEEPPHYPGGDVELHKFTAKNIKYPQEAREKGIQGTVYVSFIVDEEGKITDAKVLKGVNKILDDEALRILSLMPKWIPGKQAGKPVRVQHNMPIKFFID